MLPLLRKVYSRKFVANTTEDVFSEVQQEKIYQMIIRGTESKPNFMQLFGISATVLGGIVGFVKWEVGDIKSDIKKLDNDIKSDIKKLDGDIKKLDGDIREIKALIFGAQISKPPENMNNNNNNNNNNK